MPLLLSLFLTFTLPPFRLVSVFLPVFLTLHTLQLYLAKRQHFNRHPWADLCLEFNATPQVKKHFFGDRGVNRLKYKE